MYCCSYTLYITVSYVNINMRGDRKLCIAECLMQDQSYYQLSFYFNLQSWLSYYCIFKIHYSHAVKAQKKKICPIATTFLLNRSNI